VLPGQPVDDARVDRVAGPILREFARLYGSACDSTDLDRTRRALQDLGPLPAAMEHRDCSPWNVLVDEHDRIALADWESAEPVGLPGLDLAYFLTYLAFFRDDAATTGRFRESYVASLDDRTPTGRVVAECEARYAARVGVDRSSLRLLRLLVWPLHALSEHSQLVADGAGTPTRAVLDDALFLGLWREEVSRNGR
jgi:aminoglycoside phosphotransferase (APT) family kinase protein